MAADHTLSNDEVFDLLSSERRRVVVSYLLGADDTVDLQELAAVVAARETDKPRSALSSEEQKRVYVSLYQSHVPRLEKAGVVEYDEESRAVAPGEHLAELGAYLGESEPSLPRGHVTAAILGLAVSLAILLGLPGFENVPLGAAVVIAGGSAGLALLSHRRMTVQPCRRLLP